MVNNTKWAYQFNKSLPKSITKTNYQNKYLKSEAYVYCKTS